MQTVTEFVVPGCQGGKRAGRHSRSASHPMMHQARECATFPIAATIVGSTVQSANMQAHTLRIALAHLAPTPGDLAHNRQLVETAITTAARVGTHWIVTPELIIPGYTLPTGSAQNGSCLSRIPG